MPYKILELPMKRITSAAVAAAALLATACERQSQTTEQVEAQAEQAPAEIEALDIGATAERGPIGFTLKSVETKKAVRDPDWSPPAGPGETFVVARYEIKNLGNEPLDTFELPEVTLVDGSGVEYDSDLEASSSDGDSNGWDDVNPGIVFKGTRSFKVVEERYDPGVWQIVIKTDPAIAYRLK